jgi:hypothetical protein
MSNKIIGPQVRINRLRRRALEAKIRKLGKRGTLEKIATTIQAIVNRPTKITTLEAYLKNGWDWALFSPILVAEFPNGERFLLDGDHRKHMWRIVMGEDEPIEAFVIKVKDKQEYHRIFAEINKDNRKQCSGEETFLHKYLAGDAEAVITGGQLLYCGLAVCGSPDDPVSGYVGTCGNPLVSVSGFRRAAKRDCGTNPANVKLAADTIKSAWPNDKKIQTELLEALTILYVTYPVLGSTRKGNKISGEFATWFKDHLSITKQRDKARDWKMDGGNVHHFASVSTAKGLLAGFLSISIPGGASSKGKTLKQNKLDPLFTK